MKASPKLQDTLEVFLEELEKLETVFKEVKGFSPLLSSKIVELKSISIEPDLQGLQSELKDFENLSTQKTRQLEELFIENQKKMSESFSKQKSSLANFYLYTLFLILIACGSIYIAVKAQNNSKTLKKQLVEAKSYTTSLEEYIKDSNQITKYKKWLDKKRSK